MIRALALAFLATATLARADAPADKHTRAGIAEFTAAYRVWDAKRFANAAAHFRQAAAVAPKSAIPRYWLGTAHFHRMLQLQSQPADPHRAQAAAAAMDEAITALDSALELDPHHAECHALIGTLYGMKIHGGMIRAMRFGPSVQSHQKQALKHGLLNPRVQYLLGSARFHTAKNAADYRQALSTLLTAETLFLAEAKKPPGPLDPRWGLSSCRTFIGRACLATGDKPRAARYFKLALAEHPADHTAKRELANLNAR